MKLPTLPPIDRDSALWYALIAAGSLVVLVGVFVLYYH